MAEASNARRHQMPRGIKCPEASNAFKLPFFEISILHNKKRPLTLVQIFNIFRHTGDAPCEF
jgi:hypothetical protein